MNLKARLKYTHRRNWFCHIRFLGFQLPWIADDLAIEIDKAWVKAKELRRRKERSLMFGSPKKFNIHTIKQ